MSESDKICYEFIFYGEDEGDIQVKAFWAYHEQEAWKMADSYAFKKGYFEYKLIDDK